MSGNGVRKLAAAVKELQTRTNEVTEEATNARARLGRTYERQAWVVCAEALGADVLPHAHPHRCLAILRAALQDALSPL